MLFRTERYDATGAVPFKNIFSFEGYKYSEILNLASIAQSIHSRLIHDI